MSSPFTAFRLGVAANGFRSTGAPRPADGRRMRRQVSWLAVRRGHPAFPVSQWLSRGHPLPAHSCGGSRGIEDRKIPRTPFPFAFPWGNRRRCETRSMEGFRQLGFVAGIDFADVARQICPRGGSPSRDQKRIRCGLDGANAGAAPATVNGEFAIDTAPLGYREGRAADGEP